MCQKKHCHKCVKDSSCSLELKIGTKNMLLFAFRSVPQEEGLPTLPSISDIFNYIPPNPLTLTEEIFAQMMENMYQQTDRADLMDAKGRLSAMSDELASLDLDVIGLQEVMILSSNPIVNPDGTINSQPFTATNGYAGDENSAPEYRTFNFYQMLIDRLKSRHGISYELLSFNPTTVLQGLRTKDTLENANITCSYVLGTAILIKKKLKGKVLSQRPVMSTYARKYVDTEILVGDGSSGEKSAITFWIDVIGRGFDVVDIEVKGIPVRLINAHAPSGNSETSALYGVDGQKYVENPNSQRATFMMEALTKYIEPSPYPVFFFGDFNLQVVDEQTSQNLFSSAPMMTLLDKVGPDGTINQYTGKMIDSGFAVKGAAISGPEYKSGGFRGTCPPPFADWDCLRNPNGFYRFRIDHILGRRGDKVKFLEYGNFNTPLPTSPSQPWSFSSDHATVYAKVKICK